MPSRDVYLSSNEPGEPVGIGRRNLLHRWGHRPPRPHPWHPPTGNRIRWPGRSGRLRYPLFKGMRADVGRL